MRREQEGCTGPGPSGGAQGRQALLGGHSCLCWEDEEAVAWLWAASQNPVICKELVSSPRWASLSKGCRGASESNGIAWESAFRALPRLEKLLQLCRQWKHRVVMLTKPAKTPRPRDGDIHPEPGRPRQAQAGPAGSALTGQRPLFTEQCDSASGLAHEAQTTAGHSGGPLIFFPLPQLFLATPHQAS